jgi:hypothetical protein
MDSNLRYVAGHKDIPFFQQQQQQQQAASKFQDGFQVSTQKLSSKHGKSIIPKP